MAQGAANTFQRTFLIHEFAGRYFVLPAVDPYLGEFETIPPDSIGAGICSQCGKPGAEHFTKGRELKIPYCGDQTAAFLQVQRELEVGLKREGKR